ncbi:MAG: hypothetical protein J6T25_00815 [Bacilli bacterium]|nr:hypothetical protein [Bacilli bacterium]
MKNKLSILFLGSLVLTSCQIGGRAAADILLEDGSEYRFTTKKLSQEEYSSVFSRLKKPKIDYKYKFTLKRLGEEFYNITTKGEYANYSFDKADNSTSVYLFTASIGNSFLEESSYQENSFDGDQRTYHSETTVSYGTYNRSFDYGIATDYVYDSAGSVYTQYLNPNVPVTYPSPIDTVKVKTPRKHFYSMERFRHLSTAKEIVNLNGVDTSIVDVSVQISETDYHFTDAPVFSHKLTSKHLVIEEKRRMPSLIRSPDRNVIYGVCSEIESHSNYYFNTEYYYNYYTGHLDKVKCSFNTLSTMLEPGARISGSYTLEHQNRTFAEVLDEHYTHFFKLRNFKGVIEYREERFAR